MHEDCNEFKVIYIASTSRSGSTVLEHALGVIPGVCNCGELRRLRDFYNENDARIQDKKNRRGGCTCGNKIKNCDFWLNVEKESGLQFSNLRISSQLGFFNRGFFKCVFFLFGPSAVKLFAKKYRPFQREIIAADNCFKVYSAIAKVAKSNVIVDSSKMIHQFVMLKVVHPDIVKLIFLARDGRAVSKSMIRGERREYFIGNRLQIFSRKELSNSQIFKTAVFSWASTTAQIFIVYLKIKSARRYFVKYENICNNPGLEIKKLRDKFDITDYSRKSCVAETTSHSIGGSPSRFNNNFKNIVIDERWRSDWSYKNGRIFRYYGSLVNRLLGYK